MFRRKTRQIAAFLFSLLFSTVCFCRFSFADENHIAARIETYVSKHQDTLAGLAVSVFDDESIAYENYFGYADRETGLAVTRETVFDWGSITKLTVWISVMQLWEQGRLDLNADIREYLPDGFLYRRHFDKPITMIHLMNHQAGFEDAVLGLFTPDEREILPLESYLHRFQPNQIYEPGTVTSYSNYSTSLAAFIVERISGEPFWEYVQMHVFAPIGILNAAIKSDLSDNPKAKAQRALLQSYDSNGNIRTNAFTYIIPYPCGGCVSPLSDLRRFAQELLNPDTVLFQSSETYAALFAPTAYYGDSNIPLNSHGFWHFQCYATPLIGHGGNTTSCSSKLMLDFENRQGMVVMVNQLGESVFTHLMAETVFGEGQWEIPDCHEYLLSARTCYSGVLKIYGIVNSVFPSDTDYILNSDFCLRSDAKGVDKIAACYSDYLIKAPKDILPMYIVSVCGILSIAAAAVVLIWFLIDTLLSRIRRIETQANIFCLLYALSILAAGILYFFFGKSLLTQFFWRLIAYRMWSIGMLVLLCALIAFAVYGIISVRKLKLRRHKIMRICAVAAGIGMAVMITYWNSFMFWTT